MKLLYSTAYYSQTDDQSKRINQIAEIMLRFFITELDHTELWPNILLIL